ncbi:hypothetical protein STEG23_021825, partial [Scotinomys teguina]
MDMRAFAQLLGLLMLWFPEFLFTLIDWTPGTQPIPGSILMQREDVILEWIFLPRYPNKKLKTYIEKFPDLIHK